MQNGIGEILLKAAKQQVESKSESSSEDQERNRLEKIYPGDVYNSIDLPAVFEVIGFCAPFVIVRRKSDNRRGSLCFQHYPRFYFHFVPD